MKCMDCFYFEENDFSSGTCKRFPPVLDVHWEKESRHDEYQFSEDNPECWGQPGTELVFFKASECCEEDVSEGVFVMCKCSEEVEVHPNTELEWLVCPACKRMGKFSTEY